MDVWNRSGPKWMFMDNQIIQVQSLFFPPKSFQSPSKVFSWILPWILWWFLRYLFGGFQVEIIKRLFWFFYDSLRSFKRFFRDIFFRLGNFNWDTEDNVCFEASKKCDICKLASLGCKRNQSKAGEKSGIGNNHRPSERRWRNRNRKRRILMQDANRDVCCVQNWLALLTKNSIRRVV